MRRAAKTRHRDRDVDGLRVHYREAGIPSTTAVVLLHGAPSSSYSFREVLPVLGEHAYVVAPDIPGFGFSDRPSVADYEYTYGGNGTSFLAYEVNATSEEGECYS